MYTYDIKIYLDNGQKLYGIYKGEEMNTQQVAEKLFVGIRPNTINGITSTEGNNLFFNISHVVAFEIGVNPIN